MQSEKVFRKENLFSILFFLLGLILNQPVINIEFMKSVRAIAVTISLIISLSIWAVSAISRCGGKQLTRLLASEYSMMLFLLIIRCVKYETVNYDFALYLWYLSYVPMIFIPLLAFLSTITIDNGARLKKQYFLLFIPAIIFSLGVLGNNYNSFAFDFEGKAPSVNNSYSHSFLYYIIIAWMLIFLVGTIINGFRKSHLNTAGTGRKLLVALIIGVLVYITYYSIGPFVLRTWFVGFYEAQCLLYVLFLEICLDFGMMPTNDDHESILQNSSVWMLITDKLNRKKFISNMSMNISDADLLNSQNGKKVLIDNSYELKHNYIYGGNSYFTNDVRAMIKLNEKIEDAHEMLIDEQEILDEEVKTREKFKKIEQQNLIYEKIDERLATKNNQIKDLLDCINKDNWQNVLSKVCVVSAFVKRQSNLMILAEQNKEISLNELAFCFTESVHYINNLGISAFFSFDGSENISLSVALKIYEVFEDVIEKCWDNASGILVSLSSAESGLQLKFEIGCENIDAPFFGNDVSAEYDELDETLYISAFFNKEVLS